MKAQHVIDALNECKETWRGLTHLARESLETLRREAKEAVATLEIDIPVELVGDLAQGMPDKSAAKPAKKKTRAKAK